MAHRDGIVLAAGSACQDEDTDLALGSVSVFCHMSDCRWNQSTNLGPQFSTEGRAELAAGLLTLCAIKNIYAAYSPAIPGRGEALHASQGAYMELRRVVIKTSSEYLVNSMTIRILPWRQHGFIDQLTGRPIEDAPLLQRLDEEILSLNQLGIIVEFWLVPRELNTAANNLANASLLGMSAAEALQALYAIGA